MSKISKSIWLMQLAILPFLFSCASTHQVQMEPKETEIYFPKDKLANADLEGAIAKLRRIDPDKLASLPWKERDAKMKEMDRAWQIIKDAGPKGTLRLKEEIRRVDARNEQDHFFKLNAAALLWQIGKFDEVESILEVWRSTPLTVRYGYVFVPAFEAAKTQDERALPLLKAILKENRGIFQTPHMPIRYPLTHEFIWGTYGPKGLPVLVNVLKTSKDPVEIRSAVYILSGALYLEALPIIRELAADSNEQIRRIAITALGIYGHPQDYDFLISGLGSKDPKELWSYVCALVEYGDLRAVPRVMPLLATEDPPLKQEVILALSLLTPESFEALKKHSDMARDKKDAEKCKNIIDHVLKKLNLTWDQYLEKPREEKQRLTRAFNKMMSNEIFALEKYDRSLSRDEFLRVTKEWKESHRLDNWVKAGHLISVTTADDINLLLEVKASVLMRLSDECLYETKKIDRAILYLGRSRYRKDPGISEKVEAP